MKLTSRLLSLAELTLPRKLAAIALASGFVFGAFPLTVFAQTYVPPQRGVPDRRVGGGTRGCWQNTLTTPSDETVTAIVPIESFGYSLSTYPTIYVYVPTFFAERAHSAEFFLTDADENDLYQLSFTEPIPGGILKIDLAEMENLPPLEAETSYRWSFVLTCDPGDRSADLYVGSWFQWIEPSAELANTLTTANPSQLASIYAQAGIWYDALSNAVAFPTQLQNLLNSVELYTVPINTPVELQPTPTTTSAENHL